MPEKPLELTPEAQSHLDLFNKAYGHSKCFCYLGNAPCSRCSHPGNPLNLNKNPDAWTAYKYEYGEEGAPMEVQIETTIVVKMSLTELEAKWLKAQMQNPIHVDAEAEEPRDREMRKRFFDSLP